MELRHVRYFLAVAEERNFTRAAERLGMGQPPLSQQIKSLEQEVGTALFHRLPHGAELTAAGEAFLKSVQSLPAQAQSAITAAQRAGRGETGALRVGFTGSAAFNAKVPAAIRAFRRSFPDVELTLEEANSNGLVKALHEGLLDAAFIRPESIDPAGLQVLRVETETLIAVLPAGRLPHDRPIALASLRDEPFILLPRGLGPTLYDTTIAACREAGFEPTRGQAAPQIASVLALVAAEFGVALVPAAMRDVALTGVSYHALTDVRPVASLALAYRRGERAPAPIMFVRIARSLPD